MYKALDLAKRLVSMADADIASGGDGLTNLKLQKLLYYEQGYHLGVFGSPLFEDEIEAWMYGPVVPAVYDYYKGYNNGVLPVEAYEIIMSQEEEAIFAQIYDAYKRFSAIGLMELTHGETPWNSVPTGRGSIISKESMRDFFRMKVGNE